MKATRESVTVYRLSLAEEELDIIIEAIKKALKMTRDTEEINSFKAIQNYLIFIKK